MLIWSRVVQGLGGGGIYGLVNVCKVVCNLMRQSSFRYHAWKNITRSNIFRSSLPTLFHCKRWGNTSLLRRSSGPSQTWPALSWVALSPSQQDSLSELLCHMVPLLTRVGGDRYVTWRWIFWINLCISPISLVLIVICLRLPAPQGERKKQILHYDYVGTALLVGGTVCILLAVSWGGNDFPWRDARVIGTFVGGGVILTLFGISQHVVRDPLIPPMAVQSRAVLTIFAAVRVDISVSLLFRRTRLGGGLDWCCGNRTTD